MAAKARFCQILMTSATMILGLVPMKFATGLGSNGSKSLAIGVIGDMIFGTIALLFIIRLYSFLFADFRRNFSSSNRYHSKNTKLITE